MIQKSVFYQTLHFKFCDLFAKEWLLIKKKKEDKEEKRTCFFLFLLKKNVIFAVTNDADVMSTQVRVRSKKWR